MKTVSTGVGLCVLGVCVLGAAALSSPLFGSAATAASENSPTPSIQQAAMPPQMMLQQGLPANMGGVGSPFGASLPPNSNMASGSACQYLEPDIWFTTVHPIDPCGDGFQNFASIIGACDINGDTKADFVAQVQLIYGDDFLRPSTPTDTPVMWRDAVVVDGASTSLRYQTVMTAAPLLAFIQSQPNLPPDWEFAVTSGGWRDMDNDGDLDALATLWNYSANSAFTQVWFENTGYQSAPPPNPYDLDGDGGVNAGDIGLLLLNFGE